MTEDRMKSLCHSDKFINVHKMDERFHLNQLCFIKPADIADHGVPKPLKCRKAFQTFNATNLCI